MLPLRFRSMPSIASALLASAILGACSAGSSGGGNGGGCMEFPAGLATLQGSVDADTLAILQAGADLLATAQTLENAAFHACVAIDTDLGVADTWTGHGALDDQLTQACGQAAMKITSVLSAAAAAQVHCGLALSSGRCVVDPAAQGACEANCNGFAGCMLLGVALRCAPAALAGECDTTCSVNAVCEGTPGLEAACRGSCEGDCDGVCNPTAQSPTVNCDGKCGGNCTGTCDGKAQVAAGCAGKCLGTCDGPCDDTMAGGAKARCEGDCEGKCTGGCTIAAMGGVACGASVLCRGACSTALKSPLCEGKLAAPLCMIEAPCEDACQADAELVAKCTTPAAVLECNGTPSADVTKLVATVAKNLPTLVQTGRTQGVLSLDGATLTATALMTLSQNASGGLSGKALACATAASSAANTAASSVMTAMQASQAVVAAAKPM